MPQKKKINNDSTIQFMLAEFSTLNESLGKAIDWREERFKGFINIIFGMIALLTLTAQAFGQNIMLIYASVIISLVSYLYGIQVFFQLIHGTQTIEKYKNSIRLIRGYFVDLDSSVEQYLLLSFVSDKKHVINKRPPETTLKGLLGTVAFTNVVIIVIFSVLICVEILGLSKTSSIIIPIITGFASWLFHGIYLNLRIPRKPGQQKAKVGNH